MTDKLKKRDSLMTHVKNGRRHFQQLLDLATSAVDFNPRSRSVTPARRSASPSTVLSTIEDDNAFEGQARPKVSQKGTEFSNDQKRPNIHAALHYEAVMKEYGMPSNVNVLIGKDKHR